MVPETLKFVAPGYCERECERLSVSVLSAGLSVLSVFRYACVVRVRLLVRVRVRMHVRVRVPRP